MKLNPIFWYKKSLQNDKTRLPVVILTLVYVFSPIDFIPDLLIPFVGLLDDTALLVLMVSELVKIKKRSGSMK
jgi:uncharacterized membrane protein YkvA (DUF1232 family)